MPRKVSKKSGLETVAGRIAWYLGHLWGDSPAQMAREVGVTRGALSNVLNGRREPGRQIITAIAAHPSVNPSWLLTGEGDALISGTAITFPGEAALPVAKQLFVGLPDENNDHLLPHLMAVPRRLYRSSRYWLPVNADNPLLDETELKLAVGDHVLMEPDAHAWPYDLGHRPCIVRTDRDLAWGRGDRPTFAPASETRVLLRFLDLGEKDRREARGEPESVQQGEYNRVVAVGIFRCGGFDAGG